MTETPTLRIEAKFKNARLYNAIREQSICLQTTNQKIAAWKHGPVKAWCEFMGLPLDPVYGLLNLRLGPMVNPHNKGPRLRPLCTRIADLLGVDIMWLFPQDLYQIEWPRHLAVEADHARFVSLSAARGVVLELPPGQELALEHRELSEQIRAQLETLRPRDARILRQRFGLDGSEAHTLEEVGAAEGVTRERIRQIEARSLRQLRHPSRSRTLRPFA